MKYRFQATIIFDLPEEDILAAVTMYGAMLKALRAFAGVEEVGGDLVMMERVLVKNEDR